MLQEKQFLFPATLDYLLYLPDDYRADPSQAQPFPLILFMHGRGERGSIENLKRQGIPKLLAAGKQFPFIILSPVCPDYSWWTVHLPQVNALLDEVIATHNVDRSRIYLTGLSMGGYASWALGTEHPEKFAAIAPICGGGERELGFPERVCKLKDKPVWTFHGAKDSIVPLSETEVLVEAMQACGGEIKFTVYPDLDHNSWSITYDNPDLYSWFLSHNL
jgi:predicted peptidase